MRATWLLALPAANAFQLPFKLPFFNQEPGQQQPLSAPHVVSSKPRIAIIGAGAGGTSAAFWISKAQERFGVDVEVDLYERESYIGGRTVVRPYENSSFPVVELGASIFIKANKNMWRAVDEFNLTRRNFGDDSRQLGIWDGEKLIFQTSGGWWGWWDTAKALLRYGFHSPRRTQAVVDDMVKKFLTLYSPETPKWDSISSLSSQLEWTELVSQTTADYLKSEGVNDKFISEIVEASTRVNYGQNVDEIHALEGACSLAPNGASSVESGNFLVFEQFLKRSKANVYLNTSVKSIIPSPSGHWVLNSDRGSETYKAVILAAPYHTSGIQLPSEIAIPEQPYIHLHVTLLSTTLSSVPPQSFNLSASTKVPSMLLTTYEGARNGGKTPEFNSLSFHGNISEDENVVKIFSKSRISNKWLEKTFDGKVGWVHRKEWDAYPVLPPTSSFPDVKLAPGLYYVNAFEPFISTMETQTLSSRNVVDMLLRESFDSGICGLAEAITDDTNTTTTTKDSEDYVYGWDC